MPAIAPSTSLNNNLIINANAYKFLGVWLDAKLTWRKHINFLNQKAKSSLKILKAISGFSWGAHPITLLIVFRSLTRAILDWGSQVYDEASVSSLLVLDKIQFAALRICLGYISTTPTNVLLHLAGEPTLKTRRAFLIKRFLAKNYSATNNIIIPRLRLMEELVRRNRYSKRRSGFHSLFKFWVDNKNMFSEIKRYELFPLYLVSDESISSTVLTDMSLGMQIKNDDYGIPMNLLFRQDISTKFRNATPIHTDESRTNDPDRVGAAYYCPSLQMVRHFRLNDRSSIFTAELVAIFHSLEILDRDDVNEIVIFTDSLSSVSSLWLQSQAQKVNYTVLKIKEKVLEMKSIGKKTSIVWIPAHTGIFGNEFVDRAANYARSLEITEAYKNCEWEELSPCFKQSLINSSNVFIAEAGRTKGNKFCNLAGPFRSKAWFQAIPFSKKYICLINRIKSGHTLTPAHLFRKGIVGEEDCTCGYYSCNINHIFWHCHLFHNSRNKLRSVLPKININTGEDVTNQFLTRDSGSLIPICDFFIFNNISI